MNNVSTKLRGIVPPLVTPLTANETLDHAALERLIEHVLAGGVHGVFVLGTTGEGPSFSPDVQRDVVKRTCALVNGRVPVLVSVTHPVLSESLGLTRYAADCGAAAVVAAPPYYFPLKQDELWGYFQRFGRESALPFYLYNLPGLTKISIGEDIVRRSLELPNFRGFKDSSGDLHYFKRMQRILAETGQHSIFIGPEELLLESLFVGGDGGVSGGANAWPQLYAEIFKHAEAGDWPAAQRAQRRVMEVSRRVYSMGGYGATVTKALKAALACMDICAPTMATPHHAWSDDECAALRRELPLLNLGRSAG